MSRRRHANRSLWESTDTQYNPDAPSVRALERKGRALRVAIWGILYVAFPLACLAAFMSYVMLQNAQTDQVTVTSTDVNDTVGKPVAITTLSAWLASEPSPLPGGSVLSWDGVEASSPPVPEDPQEEPLPYSYETHRFTLRGEHGLYRSSVQVVVDGVQASAIGTPDLIPVADVPSTQSDPWFDLPAAAANEFVTDAVTDWASAYASGDAQLLRRTVRDSGAERSYMPLSGVEEVATVDIVHSAHPADVDDPDNGADESRLLVQAEVGLWWSGQMPDADDADAPQDPAVVTFDLLVLDADTASPVVVAWGGAGTAPGLDRYDNALVGVEIDTSDTEPTADDDDQAADSASTEDDSTDDAGDSSGSGESKKGED